MQQSVVSVNRRRIIEPVFAAYEIERDHEIFLSQLFGCPVERVFFVFVHYVLYSYSEISVASAFNAVVEDIEVKIHIKALEKAPRHRFAVGRVEHLARIARYRKFFSRLERKFRSKIEGFVYGYGQFYRTSVKVYLALVDLDLNAQSRAQKRGEYRIESRRRDIRLDDAVVYRNVAEYSRDYRLGIRRGAVSPSRIACVASALFRRLARTRDELSQKSAYICISEYAHLLVQHSEQAGSQFAVIHREFKQSQTFEVHKKVSFLYSERKYLLLLVSELHINLRIHRTVEMDIPLKVEIEVCVVLVESEVYRETDITSLFS